MKNPDSDLLGSVKVGMVKLLRDVSLATSVFDDSTIAALNYFSKNGFPDFSETAEFLQIVKNWWDVLNVKSLSKGKNKRNRFMRRVDSENIEEVRSYFNKFSTWIKKWQAEFPGFGLSSPTFKALIQTTTAVIDLAEYLIASDNDMGYVLLAFLQQDVLESRFCEGKLLLQHIANPSSRENHHTRVSEGWVSVAQRH